MDMNLHNREFQGTRLSQFSKRSLQCQLAVAGLLSLSAVAFLQPAQAADLGSQSGANITVNNGDKIIADTADSGGGLYGVLNPYNNTGTVNLGSGVSVSVTDPTHYAKGIVIQGANSILTATGLNVEVLGKSAVGIDLNNNKIKADLGSGSVIKVEGTGTGLATGIDLGNASTLLADRLTIETKGSSAIGLRVDDYGSTADLGSGSKITTDGSQAFGVYVAGLNGVAANGVAKFTATDLTIETKGINSYGIDIQKNTEVDLGTGSKITTEGSGSTGIWSFGKIKANALTIDVHGNSANGLEIREGTADIGAGSSVSAALGGALVTNGNSATINYIGTASNRNKVSAGGSYGASAQFTGAKINLKNTDIAIDRGGSLALGMWALGGGVMTGENLTITGGAGTRGVYAMTNSQIDLTGDLTVNMATANEIAIATQHNDGYAASRINATGKMLINGAVWSKGGLINLDMASGSLWTGDAYSDNVNGGLLNVTMNNGRWNVTDNSNLDKLVLNNTTVDLSQALTPADYSTLSVAELSGNGTFILRTDIVGDGDGVNNIGDKLVVTGTSAGSHLLTIMNRGSLATTGNEVLTVVETADGAATFSATSEVELGGYLYNVRKNGNDWELYSSGIYVPPVTPDPDPEPNPDPDPNPNPGWEAQAAYYQYG